MNIVFLGIDLAKNVFALHSVNRDGKPVRVRQSVRRDQLLRTVAELPPCAIGMEACSGAHHRAREFARFGRAVRLMAPKFVAPYRVSGRRGKNDAADAAAVCEAMQRHAMRFLPVSVASAKPATVTCAACRSAFRRWCSRLRGLNRTLQSLLRDRRRAAPGRWRRSRRSDA